MRLLIIALAAAVLALSACKRTRDIEAVQLAEQHMQQYDYQAVRNCLRGVLAAETMPDSLRAQFYYLRALANYRLSESPVGDSLLSFARDYYLSQGNLTRAVRAEQLNCARLHWVGQGEEAFNRIDALIDTMPMPHDLKVEMLMSRLNMACQMYETDRMLESARLLLVLDSTPIEQQRCKALIATALIYKNQLDSARVATDQAYQDLLPFPIDSYVAASYINLGGLYTEVGEERRALDILKRIEADDLMVVHPYSQILMRSFMAQALHNLKRYDEAEHQLDLADAIVQSLDSIKGSDPTLKTDVTYKGTLALQRIALEDQRTGKLRIGDFERLTAQREEIMDRMDKSTKDNESSALLLHGQALQLRVKMQRYMLTGAITIAALLALWVVYLIITTIKLKRQRQALELSNLEISRQKERVEASERMKSEFIQSMSHEIRTPMNIIRGFSDLLSQDSSLSERNRMYASKMIDGVDTLTHILDNLLDMSTLISMTEDDLAHDETDIAALCEGALDEMTLYNKRNLDMRFVDDTDGRHFVHTDPDYLHKILVELITNSQKFTTEGSIELRLYRDADDATVIAVTDTGIGIPPNKHEWVFGRYTKIDTFVHGIGIGLYICRIICSKLGATITIDPDYTAGTRMLISLRSSTARFARE